MLPRVWAPDLDPVAKRVSLSADESAHLTRVLRLGVGARLLVFDGRGAQYAAELIATSKSGAEVALGEPIAAAAEPRAALTLAQAVLKGDKMDAIVRDATMLGASAIVPIVTDRTVVPRSAVEQGRARDRWHRVAVASAKQCGRAVVPEIAPPCTFGALLSSSPSDVDSVSLRLQLVEPSAAAASDAPPAAGSLPADAPARVLLAIGPEGGWSAEELSAARAAGWHAWTLGARTLRAESAPLAALSVLTYVWTL